MTQLSDFPPDVIAIALAAIERADAKAEHLGEPTDTVECIADAIMADRAGRIDTTGLTKRQSECLRFILQHQAENAGLTPSVRQIASSLGLASTSGVSRLLDGLEDRGAIKRLPNRARAITIISNPN